MLQLNNEIDIQASENGTQSLLLAISFCCEVIILRQKQLLTLLTLVKIFKIQVQSVYSEDTVASSCPVVRQFDIC